VTKEHKQGSIKPGQANPPRSSQEAQARRAQALEQAAGFERMRDFAQAERIYHELLRENAQDPIVNVQLALLYRQAGRADVALTLLRNLGDLHNCDAFTCNRVGFLWLQCGQPPQAITAFEKALALQPDSIDFRFNLGLAWRDSGVPLQALDCFAKNVEAAPGHLPSLQQLGLALRECSRLQEALAVFQRATTLAPDDIEIHKCIAMTHVDLANIDVAIECWKRVLQLDPACSLAHLRLSHLRKSEHDIPAMEQLYAKAEKNVDRINLAFGLGKALEDTGRYDQAFRYLLEGNQLKRKQFRYSLEEWQAFFEKLKSIFNAEFLRGFPGAGVLDDTPIFILGMPRSGSSLVEQILASHPDVFGAGEVRTLPALCAEGAQRRSLPFPDYFQQLRDSDWRDMGAQYLAALRAKNPIAPRITDKMPQNFRFVGAISIMLPRARIVHCQRNPLDNCWSMYKNLFAEGHPYAYDLQELGKFYSNYQSLMAHWNAVLPGRIYNLSYEKLVGDPQAEIRGLLEFCELPFDQRCVDFHRNERAVNTMSAAQVKRPINADSIESWSFFRDHLEPLSRELSQGGWGRE
jgi:tetratricopeptide (TPR) repeat protein